MTIVPREAYADDVEERLDRPVDGAELVDDVGLELPVVDRAPVTARTRRELSSGIASPIVPYGANPFRRRTLPNLYTSRVTDIATRDMTDTTRRRIGTERLGGIRSGSSGRSRPRVTSRRGGSSRVSAGRNKIVRRCPE